MPLKYWFLYLNFFLCETVWPQWTILMYQAPICKFIMYVSRSPINHSPTHKWWVCSRIWWLKMTCLLASFASYLFKLFENENANWKQSARGPRFKVSFKRLIWNTTDECKVNIIMLHINGKLIKISNCFWFCCSLKSKTNFKSVFQNFWH